mgnify:CR=1 FL=1
MEKEVIFVFEETSLKEVVELLCERRINGIPVVNSDHRVVGVVTVSDIIHRTEMFDSDFDSESLGKVRASQLMTRNPIMLGPDADIDQPLAIFAAISIKQIPIVEDGQLVGILGRKDLIKGLL